MKIAIPAEADSEPRVAATPDTVKKMKALGADVVVQAGAGVKSGMLDADYEAAGASIAQSAADSRRARRKSVRSGPALGNRTLRSLGFQREHQSAWSAARSSFGNRKCGHAD